jgi:thermitase
LNNTGQNYGKGTGTADVDVDAKEAWDNGYLGTGIVVAVLDTGIDTQHPGLSGKVNCQANPSPCRDFTGTSIDDLYGHGTWTASLVASGLGDGGIVGAAPGAGLMIGKVLNNSGSGSLFDIAAGIDWAVAGGADIVSMSLGGSCPKAPVFGCNTLQTAVNNAWNAGVLLFAAAGNGGSNSTEYPGAFSNVIAVSAIDANNQLASFTDKGEIAAPGVNVFGAFPHCGGAHFVLQDSPYNKACDYDYGNGTSASTPIAAGVGALVMGEGGLSNAAVRDLLFQTADEVPGTKDGAGRVNACKALGLFGCGNLSPEVAITSPANGAAFPSGASIGFAGTAVDTEDGVLTTDLSWTSNLDGAIGSGGSFVKVLSDGTHTIVTSVSDGAGAVGSATIVVTVGSSGDGGGSGGPPCSKNSRPGCDPNK